MRYKDEIRQERIAYMLYYKSKPLHEFDDTRVINGMTDQDIAEELLQEGIIGYEQPIATKDSQLSLSEYRTIETYKPTISTFEHEKATENETNEGKNHTNIHIKRNVYLGMVKAVQALGKNSKEIGGFMKVEEKKGEYHITDFKILKQTVSSGDFEINDEEVMHFMSELEEKEEPLEQWGHWWHSHHNMGLFWSGTDDAQFESLLTNTNNYVMGIVFNNEGDFKARVDMKTTFGTIILDGLTIQIEQKKLSKEEQKIVQKKEKEALQKAKERTTISYNSYNKDTIAQLDNEKWFKDVSKPYDLQDLVKLTGLHKELFTGWELEDECHFWGINYKEVKKKLYKKKNKKNRRIKK